MTTTTSRVNPNVSDATARAAAKAATENQPVTFGKALNTALADALTAEQSVVIFGEDVGTLGGVFRITDGLTARQNAPTADTRADVTDVEVMDVAQMLLAGIKGQA